MFRTTVYCIFLDLSRDGGVVGRDDEPFRTVDDTLLLPLEVMCCVEALRGEYNGFVIGSWNEGHRDNVRGNAQQCITSDRMSKTPRHTGEGTDVRLLFAFHFQNRIYWN